MLLFEHGASCARFWNGSFDAICLAELSYYKKRPMRSLSVILYFLLFRCVNKGAKFLTAWIILSAGFFQLLKVTAYFKQEFVFLRGSAVVGLRSMVQYVSFIPVDE